MIKSLTILGRQPALGLAELESLYGSADVVPFGNIAATLRLNATEVDFKRLGGSTRLANVLGEVDSSNWKAVEKALRPALLHAVRDFPEGKVKLGISVYGLKVSPAAVTAAGLTLKKALRSAGRSARTVPNVELELNTAQVQHNALDGPLGCELLCVSNGTKTIIAHTVAVQDLASYTLRDRGRPKRDARVGMLPPKLAQIILNLAVGNEKRKTKNEKQTILDPFCGTGVVLQEALLMGYDVKGTDLEPRMIDYTKTNLDWLYSQTPDLQPEIISLETGDATTHSWDPKIERQKTKNLIVACETYLGRPFTTTPTHDVLEQTVSDVNVIIKKFISNIAPQLKSGARLCLAVPAWQIAPNRFRHLPLIENLENSPLSRIHFEHVQNTDLLYYRADQIVARELLVLEKP